MRRAKRRYSKARKAPFAGTNYVERRYYDVQPSLAGVALSTGPLTERDRAVLARGYELLAWLEAQHVPQHARGLMSRTLGDVRRLSAKAEAR